MMQLRFSGSWCSKCPLKKKKKKEKEGKEGDLAGCWISNRILSSLLLGHSFQSSLGWSSHHLLPLQGHRAPTDQRQVSPAFHIPLINVMVLWRSQERTEVNKPAPRGEFETDHSEPLLSLPSSRNHIQQYLERLLLFLPLPWASNPI